MSLYILYDELLSFPWQTKNWQMALKLYDEIKEMNLKRTVSMMNALVTALCMSESLCLSIVMDIGT